MRRGACGGSGNAVAACPIERCMPPRRRPSNLALGFYAFSPALELFSISISTSIGPQGTTEYIPVMSISFQNNDLFYCLFSYGLFSYGSIYGIINTFVPILVTWQPFWCGYSAVGQTGSSFRLHCRFCWRIKRLATPPTAPCYHLLIMRIICNIFCLVKQDWACNLNSKRSTLLFPLFQHSALYNSPQLALFCPLQWPLSKWPRDLNIICLAASMKIIC